MKAVVEVKVESVLAELYPSVLLSQSELHHSWRLPSAVTAVRYESLEEKEREVILAWKPLRVMIC